MNKEQIWKEEAEKHYPIVDPAEIYQRHRQNAYIAGAQAEHTRDKWIKIEEGLPDQYMGQNVSDWLLCVNKEGIPLVSFYNFRKGEWDCKTEQDYEPTHYQIIEPPKQ